MKVLIIRQYFWPESFRIIEALMASVPVICSNQVGVGAGLEKGKCRDTFVSESVSGLVGKLKELLMDPVGLDNMRLAAGKAGMSPDLKCAAQSVFNSQDFAPVGVQKMQECPWYE